MGLGFMRFPREAVEGLLERARRVLACPLAILAPPPPPPPRTLILCVVMRPKVASPLWLIV